MCANNLNFENCNKSGDEYTKYIFLARKKLEALRIYCQAIKVVWSDFCEEAIEKEKELTSLFEAIRNHIEILEARYKKGENIYNLDFNLPLPLEVETRCVAILRACEQLGFEPELVKNFDQILKVIDCASSLMPG